MNQNEMSKEQFEVIVGVDIADWMWAYLVQMNRRRDDGAPAYLRGIVNFPRKQGYRYWLSQVDEFQRMYENPVLKSRFIKDMPQVDWQEEIGKWAEAFNQRPCAGKNSNVCVGEGCFNYSCIIPKEEK